ncbi:MAG: UDP-N-acetylmuramate dehydrogenase [Nitrospirae bacterium]|nr:UDP-N-acetylmuramate dehydrogenase [Nitrospirota bacterium]
MKNIYLKVFKQKDFFKGELKFNEMMSRHTSLKIGGPADIYAVPQDLTSLRELLVELKRAQLPFYPLGGGTNLLIKDGGIQGAIVSLRFFRRIGTLREDGIYIYLNIEAGVPLQRLVSTSAERGLTGVEGLVGIPGTAGGAICGNSGAFGYEMKDVVISADIMNDEGKITTYKAEDLQFRYRSSGVLPTSLIISAEIKLKKAEVNSVSAKIEEFLKIKREKQPIWEVSAGCVFKNPPGLSAGKLIDDAGCKGMRVGDVEVSNVHANFFINKGRAKASDFIKLMQKVSDAVRKKTKIILEPEIKIIGRDVKG